MRLDMFFSQRNLIKISEYFGDIFLYQKLKSGKTVLKCQNWLQTLSYLASLVVNYSTVEGVALLKSLTCAAIHHNFGRLQISSWCSM